MSFYPKLLVFVLGLSLAATLEAAAPRKSSGSSSGAPVHVKGYTRKDGTYVAPHDREASR